MRGHRRQKVDRLRAGETPIYEPGLEELLARNRERLHFDTVLDGALADARLLFAVAVGTPPTTRATPTSRPCTRSWTPSRRPTTARW